MIKRKVNNNRKNSLEDSDFSDYQSEWRGGNNISSSSHNPHSKKNIEEIYTDLVKNLEEVGKKQKELELKASLIEKKNDSFVNENLRLTHEMKEKRAYTKNLEIVIYFIFELMMKKRGVRETDTASTRLNAEDDKLYEDLSSLIIKNPDFDLTHINSMIEDDEKANLMRNLMENINENVLKTVIENSLQKYGLTMDDINLTISKKGMSQSSLSQFIQELNNCHNCEKKLKKLPSYDFETNLSSPTSLISTTDLLRSLSAKSKSSTPTNFTSTLLNIKRKRTDESIGEFGSGNLNLNQKEKETFFDEITGLTPQLISSPNMSPARAKKSDAAFLSKKYYTYTNTFLITYLDVNSNSNNIFGPQSHKNSVDNLYAFSLEDNLTLSNIINVDEKRIKDN